MNYYRKFLWFWESILCFLAVWILVPALSPSYNQLISLFHLFPNVLIYGLMGLLVICGVFLLIVHGKQLYKGRQVIEKIIWGLLLVIYADRIVLNFISLWIDCANMTARPDGFLATMLYMVIKERKIWLNGILGTLKVSTLGTLLAFLLSILLLFMRVNEPQKRDHEGMQLLKLIGNTFEKVYVTVIRGTPMMVQAAVIYYAGFGLTKSLMAGASITEINNTWSFYTAGLITVTLNSAAYLAEVLRGAVESLDKGQKEAAASLGFTNWQAMIKIIFPQAVRNSLPAIGNEFIINIKDTSVLNIIGFVELMFATATVAGKYYQYLTSYCISAVIYLILTWTLTRLLALIGRLLGSSKSVSLPSSN